MQRILVQIIVYVGFVSLWKNFLSLFRKKLTFVRMIEMMQICCSASLSSCYFLCHWFYIILIFLDMKLHIVRGVDLRSWFMLWRATQILLKLLKASKQRKHFSKNLFHLSWQGNFGASVQANHPTSTASIVC